MTPERAALIERSELRGSAFTDAYTDLLDGWLQEIASSSGLSTGLALAVSYTHLTLPTILLV